MIDKCSCGATCSQIEALEAKVEQLKGEAVKAGQDWKNSLILMYERISENKLLKAENERLSKSKWISVKDRLPEYGQKVIAYMEDRDSAILTVFLDGFALARTGVNGFEDHGVSHWMRLPDAPE
jgi:hypothetical protein